ncbi:MAG: thiol:disulfide interchange protein DsbA/DsbL [Xanthomonadales bacterium]|nr:thiol:disulfide interchange protein DsbA/DsbL [Xanthomonadales bacterium]
MKHRLAAFFCLLLAVGAMPASAQLLYEEGKHYFELENPQPTDGDGPEVIEFFSYGCPHCYEFEPALNEWLESKPEAVSFYRLPTGLGRDIFERMSAAYYIAEELGVAEQIHTPLFEEIHEKRNRRIVSLEGLAEFLARFGVSRQDFLDALNSDRVQQRFAAGESKAPAYEIMGVPTLVVNGRYRVTRGEHVTSFDQMLDIVDFLLDQ